MTTGGVKREPRATLCADVEGYSRLIDEDEERTAFHKKPRKVQNHGEKRG